MVAADRPTRSWPRRIARVVGRLLGGLVLLLALALAYLHTRWGKEMVRGRLEAALGAAVDGHVAIGSLDYGFLFDGVDVGGVEIRGRDGQPALAIGAVHVELDRGRLLGGAPVIDKLEITGLAVAVTQGADGRTNLDGLAKPSSRPPLAAIAVRALVVHGDVVIAQPEGRTIELHDLAITGAIDAHPADGTLAGTLGPIAAKLTITRPDAPSTVADLAIAQLVLARGADAVDVDVHGLALGALSVASLHGHAALANGALVGAQAVAITGARVDHTKLATELGRALLAQDLTLDATVTGPASALAIHGVVATGSTQLALDGTADVSALAHPRYQLVLAGRGASADVMLPPGAARMPAIETQLRIAVDGSGATLADVDAAVTLDIGRTQIGAIVVDGLAAKLHARRGAYAIESLHAHGLGFEVDGTGDVAADTTLHARVAVAGDPTEAMRVLHAAGIEIPRKVPRLSRLALAVTAAGKVDGALDVQLEPMQLALAGGAVAVTGAAHLEARQVQDASTALALRGIDLRQLAALAGAPPPAVEGTLSGHVAITRSATVRRVDGDVAIALRAPALTVRARGHADGHTAAWTGAIERTADHAVLGTLTAQLPIAEQGLVPTRAWHVVVDLTRRPLAELAALVPVPSAGAAPLPPMPEGDLALHADIAGTPAAPRGTIDATVNAARPELGALGPAHAALHAVLGPAAGGELGVTITGRVDPVGAIAASLTVPLRFVGGAIDRPRLRAGLAGEVRVDLPDHALASLPGVPPALAALGGTIGGHVTVRGALAHPEAAAVDAQLAWRGYHTVDGAEAATTLAVTGTPAALAVRVDHAGALALTADLARTGERVAITARVQATDTPLVALLPALPVFAAEAWRGADLGRLRSDLVATLALVREAGAVRLESGAVTGALAVTGGAFALPGTTRRWHDIGLELAGTPDGLRLATLDVHESDAQVADRRLHASGTLTLAQLVPRAATLVISTRDWLALGSRSPLLSDAPTAAVDLDAHVAADLSAPVVAIDATIDHLDLRNPDRRDRAHQPEVSSIAGDVIFVDSPAQIGRLPVPPPPAPPTPTPGARPTASCGSAGAGSAAEGRCGAIAIRIHMPTPIHALRAPLDITAQGELAVTVRDGLVATRGELAVLGGTLTTFGAAHELVRGRVRFTAEHPHGDVDLLFVRRLPDWTARDLAQPERGVQIHLTGEALKPTIAITGVANDALWDIFATSYAGHPQFVAPPGLPATATVEVPHGDALNILAYLSLTLPQLLFLDRSLAWADPSEPRGAYGRIRDVELDRYTQDERARVRVVGRPTEPGRSTAEVQLDHLWLHSDHAALGGGLRAGDRGGGGLGLFFEWSSAQ